MKNKSRRLGPATYPVTISTPYGSVKVLLSVQDEQFAFMIAESDPGLCTRAAEPFLYRFSQVAGLIADAVWWELMPGDLRGEIESDCYTPADLASALHN